MHAWKTFKNYQWTFMLVGLAIVLFLLSKIGPGSASQPVTFSVSPTMATGVTFPIRENKAVYAAEEPDVKEIYVTIADKENQERFASFSQFDYEYETVQKEKEKVRIRFDSTKPGLLDTLQNESNAVLTIRGHSSADRSVVQKSFKIKMDEAAGTWMGQHTLNLNKHPTDITRIRNKLSFDLIETIPQMFGLRTQFVHLYIRDLSDSEKKDYVDYGLYTHVEQVNQSYLKSHGIAENAYLYKVNNFEFRSDPIALIPSDSPAYDADAFSILMESGGLDGNTRLIDMVRDVNDLDLDIDTVVERHFDRENYLYWLAFNLLTGNLDTNSQNFYLMSPVSDSRWYFIPWDYDGAWNFENQDGVEKASSWMKSNVSNYWGVILHNRFLKNPDNRADLMAVMETLNGEISSAAIRASMETYRVLTEPLVFSAPDVQFLPAEPTEYAKAFEWMPDVLSDNLRDVRDNLQLPQPVYMAGAAHAGGAVLSWDESFDFQGDNLAYAVTVSLSPDMTNPVFEEEGTDLLSLDVLGMNPGVYFWNLKIWDEEGHVQLPFDQYVDSDGIIWHGVLSFVVPEKE